MCRATRDAIFKATVVGLFVFFLTAGLAHAADVASAAPAVVDPFTSFVSFLKASGPLGVAVLAGYWAYKKDKEKNALAEKHEAQMKAMFDQVVVLVQAQTGANVKMESAVSSLRSTIESFRMVIRPGASVERVTERTTEIVGG